MLYMSELREYGEYLRDREMSENTVGKYLRDAENFLQFSNGREISRELMMEYKSYILNAWKISSVNSMITAVNSYLKWAGQAEFSIHTCRVQKQIFREKSRELGKEEYYRLLNAAVSEKRERLSGILRTIAATGMRIGELRYLTVETLSRQKIEIYFKGKQRVILMARSLVIFLRDYCRRNRITSGIIFATKNGNPVDRRNIWAEMKELCEPARVLPSKVFPHNLRHLFARCFYERERDLVRLADYLGHSSIETTRRYTMITSEEACARELELGLAGNESWGGAEKNKTEEIKKGEQLL